MLESEAVLFVGLSFEDPNLRRLIDGAKSARKGLKFYNICRLPFERAIESTGSPLDKHEVEVSVLDEVYRNIGVQNIWVDEFDPDIPILLDSLLAEDTVQNFTRQFRSHLESELISKGLSSDVCQVYDCSKNRVSGMKFCVEHSMGGRSRFMHYAPTPKTANDQCSIKNCQRITSGLSDTCKKHALHGLTIKSSGREKSRR